MRPTRILASAIIAIAALACARADEQQFLSNVRQLTFEGRRSGEGYFSPDGRQLIFQSEREPGNPFYQIYMLDFETGDTHRVSPGVGKTTCSYFRPNSDEVIFASTHHDPNAVEKQKAELERRASGKQKRYEWDYDEEFEIYAARRDGSNLRRLTHARGYDAECAFSPDGKQIVFCSMRDAYPPEKLSPEDRARLDKDPSWFGEIYIMNADGSEPRRLTNWPGYDGGPFFTPDGQRIVWRHFDEKGNADVYTMALDGSDRRRVTDFGSMSWAPYFHPSGKYIVFTSNKLGFSNFELFIGDAGGEREPVRVTFTDGFDGLPVFSADGKKLCWTSNRGGGQSQLWLADWNDEAARKAIEAAPKHSQSAPSSAAAQSSPEKKHASETTSVSDNGDAAAFSAEITKADLQREVEWLADEKRDGRMTGSPGAQATADWLAGYFRNVGLKSFDGSYTLPFEFNAGERVIPEKNKLVEFRYEGDLSGGPIAGGGAKTPLFSDRALAVNTDFRPLAFSENGETEGDVVFAGYGLVVPGDGQQKYDSYAGLDAKNVKDKIVLLLRYVPEGVDAQRRAHLNRYAGLRYKAMLARERGAKAVLIVTGPNSPNAGEVLPLTNDGTNAGSGILAASISGKVADALLAPSGKTLKNLQAALDTENPHAESGFVLPKVKVHLACGIEHLKKSDRDVVAYLPPTVAAVYDRRNDQANKPAAKLSEPPEKDGDGHRPPLQQDEYVLIGAHYDHLGHGGISSLQRAGEEGKIHPGADDNASGVAWVMELAASLAKERAEHPEKFRRGVIFACWSGEEIGLIGSAAFCEKPPVPLDRIVAYVNADMVGRLRDNKLTLQGVGSSGVWRRLIEKRNVAAGFNLVLQDDPYLPTDVTAFYPKNIPVLNFFTGAHEDYHRPTDTADNLDYDGLERITKFARQIVLDLVQTPERPDYAKVAKSSEQGGSRETLRAYLGTIPDYTTEVKGVKLSGVRGGSPAEKGGLKGGDVIVEFAGQKIANIYDYTYALDAVKIGKPVEVVVERGGQRVKITVTPEARK
jgi:Tol biopolymer transport system component